MSDLQLALPGVTLAESHGEWIWAEESDEEIPLTGFEHATVLTNEVVQAIAPRPGGIYVDATLGGGGHTEAMFHACPDIRVIAFDRDPKAIDAARERLRVYGDRVSFVRSNFSQVKDQLFDMGIEQMDGICADLGVSSPQLDDAARGMSFRREGPIDMRMDPDGDETALDLIGRLDDEDLADVIFRYGDERRSRRIARSIRRAYEANELESTLDLRRAIVRAVGPARIGGVDPATRTFQALRIAVNSELEELKHLLEVLPVVVAPEGIAAIISFHSLEDRLVKSAFTMRDVWQPLTKKPVVAADDEQATNPRARSAKLRAARRQKQE